MIFQISNLKNQLYFLGGVLKHINTYKFSRLRRVLMLGKIVNKFVLLTGHQEIQLMHLCNQHQPNFTDWLKAQKLYQWGITTNNFYHYGRIIGIPSAWRNIYRK